jgi:hypothetical protein
MSVEIRNGLTRQQLVSMRPCMALALIWREMEHARAGFCENCVNGSHKANHNKINV